MVQRRLIRNMRFMDPERDVDDQTLLSEAFELRLHLADEVIRRRTVQVMEALIVASRGNPRLPRRICKLSTRRSEIIFRCRCATASRTFFFVMTRLMRSGRSCLHGWVMMQDLSKPERR